MKVLKECLFLIVGAGLFLACSRSDYDKEISGISLKDNPNAPEVIVVTPSGGDDTDNLLAAFAEAMSHGPGNIVKLVEGEYHVGYMEVYDFVGSLQGAGKGKTVITVLPGMDLDALFAQHLLHCVVKFIGGDVHLGHFTMQTPPGSLSTGGPGWGHIYSLLNFSTFNPFYESGNENRSINVVIDNASFKGQRVEEGGYPGYAGYNYNCVIGIRAGFDYFSPYVVPDPLLPREKINFKITNCDFETFCYGLGLEGMTDSRVIIGEMNGGNTFSNIDQAGGVWESRNTEVSIEGNTINIPEFSYGLDLDDYPFYEIFTDVMPEKASVYLVRNNIFNMNHSQYAIALRNIISIASPEEPLAIYQVQNNLFNMSDGYDWGILSLYTTGAVIRNNRFTGYGDLGLYLVNWSKGGLVLGNSFSAAQFGSAVAYLTPSTSDWTFVGGNIADQVINLGTNNIITGFSVNYEEAPFGQTIVDNLQLTKDAIHEMKNNK